MSAGYLSGARTPDAARARSRSRRARGRLIAVFQPTTPADESSTRGGGDIGPRPLVRGPSPSPLRRDWAAGVGGGDGPSFCKGRGSRLASSQRLGRCRLSRPRAAGHARRGRPARVPPRHGLSPLRGGRSSRPAGRAPTPGGLRRNRRTGQSDPRACRARLPQHRGHSRPGRVCAPPYPGRLPPRAEVYARRSAPRCGHGVPVHRCAVPLQAFVRQRPTQAAVSVAETRLHHRRRRCLPSACGPR